MDTDEPVEGGNRGLSQGNRISHLNPLGSQEVGLYLHLYFHVLLIMLFMYINFVSVQLVCIHICKLVV
jgi:hypothetical protein